MGLAALFVGILIAVVIVVAIVYGTILGLGRFGRGLWRFLAPEAREEAAGTDQGTGTLPCWEEKECPPSVREACPAYLRKAERLPCWLVNMRAEGRLRVGCLTCQRFHVADLVA